MSADDHLKKGMAHLGVAATIVLQFFLFATVLVFGVTALVAIGSVIAGLLGL